MRCGATQDTESSAFLPITQSVGLFQVAVGLGWVSMGARSPHGVGTLPGCTAFPFFPFLVLDVPSFRGYISGLRLDSASTWSP